MSGPALVATLDISCAVQGSSISGYVAAGLGDPGGVLIGDDSGFEKKGSCSAGVQRQYAGTAGKITNCQVGVFLAYASPKGRALVDRELYLPRSWTDGRGPAGRRESRGGPRVPDKAYGGIGPLRAWLGERGTAYVLAIARDHLLATPTGPRRADVLAAAGGWQRMSCGNGAKGRRWYDWALAATDRQEISLLARRSTVRPAELAFYLCYTPRPVPLGVLVKVAGTRWCVEECFQAAKNEAGMDHYQVRRHGAWYRYVTLARLALAWLAVTRAGLADDGDPLMTSANEIRRMFSALCGPPRDEQHARSWSRWRRHRQERARHFHYQRQRLIDH